MAIDEEVIGLNKKIVELEVQRDKLIKDKSKLMEEVMGVRAKCTKLKEKCAEMKAKLDSEKQKWMEEEDKWTELGMKKRKLEIDLEAVASKQKDGDEAVAKLRETQAYVETLKRTLEERDGRIQELEMEACNTCKLEEENLELIRMIQVLESGKEQMVAQLSNLREENIVEAERYHSALDYEKKRYSQLEEEKRKLEIPQQGNEVDVKNVESLLEERNDRINKLSARNGVLERQKKELEMEFKAEMDKEATNKQLLEKNNLELFWKVCGLEAQISELEREKNDQADSCSNVNEALEVEKKRMEELKGKIHELMKGVGALENERDRMVTQVSNLSTALEAEKRRVKECQAKVTKLNRETKAKINKISKEKMVVETEKRAFAEQSSKKIEVLIRDKREVEESACRANMEKDAEIARILKEKTDMAKKMSEREEAIKMIDQENQALEARIKELENELKAEKLKMVLKSEKDV